MTKKEFAEKLNGRQYAAYPQFLPSEIQTAKENGFVIVYGASDDLMEFAGRLLTRAAVLMAEKCISIRMVYLRTEQSVQI